MANDQDILREGRATGRPQDDLEGLLQQVAEASAKIVSLVSEREENDFSARAYAAIDVGESARNLESLLRLFGSTSQGEGRADRPDQPPPSGGRPFGAFAGRFSVDDAFFEPLSAEELQEWEET